jgi:HD-GYP domain-containing protein (c-di-GMP phosphodiesterase class II)
MIRVAALLHDYGKIGVPDSILKKNGMLTEEEYETVKSHAEETRKILEQVNFEGIFSQIPEIAGSHHEKINGTGYPKGLKGNEIPLGAKIIAVADYFEAITSKRHYRDPMPLDKALQMLQERSGSYFEKGVVDAFLNHFAKDSNKSLQYNSSQLRVTPDLTLQCLQPDIA